ncbi:uncharacterized protein LOC116813876 isoform X2 [Hylobates moloch]|uniref:uncharacterized protein LOC116813876 isoform X2 n=1 Tax=Hylobates moloch TaxID=81572 RepID=UPI0026747652|nr:uncharacterized protein LOC116813876 isoform X2 [Hylobates moloch]
MLTCVGAGTGEPEAAHTVCSSPALRRPHSRTVVLHVPLAASRTRLRPAGLRGSRGCTDESACPLEANESPRRPVAEELGIPPTGPRRQTPCGPRPSCPRRCTPSTAWPARCSSRPTGPWTSCWVAEEGGGRRRCCCCCCCCWSACPWRCPACRSGWRCRFGAAPSATAPLRCAGRRPRSGARLPNPGAASSSSQPYLCLLPDGLPRFSNLPHSQRLAEAIGAALLAGARPALHGATDCSQPWPRAPRRALVASLPVGLDFVCLQEVFDLRAARRLMNRLGPNLGPLLYAWARSAYSSGRTSSCWTAGCCWPQATRCCAPPSVASPTHVARTLWPPRDYCLHRHRNS